MNRRFNNRNQPNKNSNDENHGNNQRNHHQQSQHRLPKSQNMSEQIQSLPSTKPPPPPSGECVVCKSSTILICPRCDDFYCSPDCQKKDWPKHRYVCFRMPMLVSSSAMLNNDIPPLHGYINKQLPQVSMNPPNAVASQLPSQHEQKYPSKQQEQHQKQQQQKPRQQQQQQQQKPQSNPNNSTTPNVAPQVLQLEQVAFPKNNSRVMITSVRSSNRFFIRSTESADNKGYCNVIKAINAFAKTARPFKCMPQRNALAITDFDNDGSFYRVQVVQAKNENEIQVIYTEFGNEATKKLSELKEISQSCAEQKQYIIPITLKGVPYIKDDPKLMQFIKKFEDVDAKIVYYSNDTRLCSLVLFGDDESINDKITSYINKKKEPIAPQNNPQEPPKPQVVPPPITSQAGSLKDDVKNPSSISGSVKGRPSQLAKPVMTPPFEFVTLPMDKQNLTIIVVDNSLMCYGYIACVLDEAYDKMEAVQRYLSEYKDTGLSYKPKIHEYCLAKFEDAWFRAKVLSIPSESEIEVVFCEFLNESRVPAGEIRRFPMDLDIPCATNLCIIEELSELELTKSDVEYLSSKLIPGSKHTINKIIGTDPEDSSVIIVQMDDVVQWLADK